MYWFPRLTFVVEWLPKTTAGRAYGPVILISKGWEDDHRLWMHEYEHVRQFWKLPMIHSLLYKFSKRYRGYAEARAYAVQTQEDLYDLDLMASRLAGPLYGLGLSFGEALTKVTDQIINMGYEA